MVFRRLNKALLSILGRGFVLYGHGVAHKRRIVYVEYFGKERAVEVTYSFTVTF